ncbi:MAG: ABC transporter substrate-binding protein [Anaerolineae bacterium]|nr:ABC transporter substrate-binding protein [Anaerolineae bacterium]
MTDQDQHVETYDFRSPVDYIPQRVISLVPSVTESLFDLNLGDRVIGVTDYCTRPEDTVNNIPRVGGTKNPDIERIKLLRPDLVIMNTEENRREDAEALTAAGLAVWETGPRTVKEAIELLWQIMNVFEEAAMTERVRQIEINYEMTLKYMTAEPAVRAFVPIWRDPWMTFNRDTYLHDLLATIGVENIFADRDRQFPLGAELGTHAPLPADDPRVEGRDTRYPRVSLDEVIAAQPDLILLPSEPFAFSQSDVDELSRLAVPAAKTQQILLVDGSLLTWHGTRLAYALQELPPIINTVRTALRR